MQTVLMYENKVKIYAAGFQRAKKQTLFSLIDLTLLLSSKVIHFVMKK